MSAATRTPALVTVPADELATVLDLVDDTKARTVEDLVVLEVVAARLYVAGLEAERTGAE